MPIIPIAIVIFIIGYAIITLEHRIDLHKSFTAAALGGLLWLLIGVWRGPGAQQDLEILGSEIFGLIAFLFFAMTLVEILNHYDLFDFIRIKILKLELPDALELWVIGAIAFGLSAAIDNLTAAIAITQIALRFFRGRNLLIAAATIVIAANAGGAWSPLGDVTTTMLWLAGKFTAPQVIIAGFLPSLTIFMVSTWLMGRKLTQNTQDVAEEDVAISKSEWAVIAVALASFALPFVFSSLGLAPYLGLLAGLGIVGVLIALVKRIDAQKTHLEADIEMMLANVKFASLLFFIGILLAVGALGYLGVLDKLSERVFGSEPQLWRLIGGSAALGVLSAIIDNIPLTAAAIDVLGAADPAIWALLALAVGSGGSLLIIGSAAGIVAMSTVKELTFFRYLKIATVPALAGYCAGIAVWYVQYQLFFS